MRRTGSGEPVVRLGVGGIDVKITMFFLFLPHRVVLRLM